MTVVNAPSSSAPDAALPGVDFDLRGVVGIRLLDASPADVAGVERQLGHIRAPLGRQPDLVIRFVDRVESAGPVRLLGIDDAGYTDEAFLVLRSGHRAGVRIAIPFDRLGATGTGDEPAEITCQRGLRVVPHLIAIVNLLALARGVVPLHASSFVHRGAGILVTGWSKGGKTETLLAALADGARYMSDEWTYLRPDGTVFGVPEPIRIWDWQLRQLPRYRAVVGRTARIRLAALRLAADATRGLAAHDPRQRTAPGRLLARAVPVLARQPWVRVDPARLSGPGGSVEEAPVDRLVLVVSHDRPGYDVVPADAGTIVGRMVASLAYESLDLRAAYLAQRFAFPDRRNRLIDGLEGEADVLARAALAHVPAVEVRHPYPFRIDRLFAAVSDATRP